MFYIEGIICRGLHQYITNRAFNKSMSHAYLWRAYCICGELIVFVASYLYL